MSNCITETVNYFNPFATQFKEASKDFSNLTLTRKILAVAASIFGGLITPFLLFTGSFAGFQVAVKWLKQSDNNVSDRTPQTGHQSGVFFPPPNIETDFLETLQTVSNHVVVREFGLDDEPGEFTGIGKKTYKNGSFYKGEFQQGLPHGNGILTFEDGISYEGEFINGHFEGIGKLTFEDGRFYEGQFKQGNLHGKGIVTYPNGTTYEGHFRHGNLHRPGKVTLPVGIFCQYFSQAL